MTRAELEAAIAAIPDATLRAAALARCDQAMRHIQQALNEMDRACEMLSGLCYGAPEYNKAWALREKVHAFWYVVEALRQRGKVRLDSTNVEALAARLAAQAAAKVEIVSEPTAAEAERMGVRP
jgi:hypothetical protein